MQKLGKHTDNYEPKAVNYTMAMRMGP